MPIITGRENVLAVYEQAAKKGWVIPCLCSENLTTTEAILTAASEFAAENGYERIPVTLAITNHISAYIAQSVTALGVDYTLITPSVDAVVSCLQDFIQQYSSPNDALDIHAQVVHHLRLLGIPTHLDGYRQLCLALPEYAANPQQRLTKELYPAVAALCQCVDGRSVEHSIRKAIRSAWLHRDNAIWRKYFPMGSGGSIPCPTNKAFICRLAELLHTSKPI